MKKNKLYSVFFPTIIWFIYSPLFIVISIIGNIIVDSLAIAILSFVLFQKLDREFFRDSIIKVYFIGILSNIIASVCLNVFGLLAGMFVVLEKDTFFYNLLINIHVGFQIDCFSSVIGFIFMFSGVIISSVLIYFFNYKYTYAKDVYWLTEKQKRISCLFLAIFTAPYSFLVPPAVIT